jgi:hypothetical protein
VFDAKAGASLTAQAVMVGEVNTALAWQADSMAVSLDYKNSAVSSAATATVSANNASASAAAATTNGATQVALATAKADSAAASAYAAQVAATAAGTAAGLPNIAGVDAFDVLQINAEKSGVQWGKSGQNVGDLLTTANNPGVTYAATNRATYLQSAYPDLYALLGAAADADRAMITYTSPFGSDNVQNGWTASSGDLIIALCASVSFCYTSTDGGLSWVRRPTPRSDWSSIIVKDGVFLATIQGTQGLVYTTTDGINWAQRNLPNNLTTSAISGVVSNLFIVAEAISRAGIYYTSSDGITWTVRSGFPTAQAVVALSSVNGNVVCISGNSSVAYTFSVDGINWLVGRFDANNQVPYKAIAYSGGIYYGVNESDGILYSSTTLMSTAWTKTLNVFVSPAGDVTTPSFNYLSLCASSKSSVIYANSSNSTRAWVSNDGGETWFFKITPANFNGFNMQSSSRFFAIFGNLLYAIPYRTYDPKNSFITPKVYTQSAPLQTYIKGRLV